MNFSRLICILYLFCPIFSFSKTYVFRVSQESQKASLQILSERPIFYGHKVLEPAKIWDHYGKKIESLKVGTYIEIQEEDLFRPKQYFYKFNLESYEHSQIGFVKGVTLFESPEMSESTLTKLHKKEVFISFQELSEMTEVYTMRVPILVPLGMDWKKEIPKEKLLQLLSREELFGFQERLKATVTEKSADPQLPEIYRKLQQLYQLSKGVVDPQIENEKNQNEVQLEKENQEPETCYALTEECTLHEHCKDHEKPLTCGGVSFEMGENELLEILSFRKFIFYLNKLAGEEAQPILDFFNAIPQGIPVKDGAELSSGFKERWGRFHAGFDYTAKKRAPLIATAPGTVIFRGYSGAYGNLVKIQVENLPIQIWYGHIDHNGFRIDLGDQVEKGQIIAHMGSTGRSTGVHVHYEVRILDPNTEKYLPINPAEFVK